MKSFLKDKNKSKMDRATKENYNAPQHAAEYYVPRHSV